MSKIDIDKFVASLLKAPEGWNEWAIDSEDIKKALADQHLEYKDGEIVSTVYVSGNYSLSISNTKLGTITGGGTYTIPIEPQSNEKQGEQKPIDYEHATITQKDDERIRKELIKVFSNREKYLIDQSFGDITVSEALAWLEKQDNCFAKWQKNTPDNKPTLNHSVLMKTTHGVAEGYFVGSLWFQFRWSSNIKDSDVLAWMELSDLDEQGEQKPTSDTSMKVGNSLSVNGKPFDYEHATITQKDFAPKEEPKFKVGDYIVYDYCMGRIVEITNDAYLLDIGQGIPFSCEDNVHLWTIQDANEGNIIAGKIDGDNYILIFKTIKDGWIETYGHYYNAVNRFCVPSQLFCRDYQCTFTPATEEQRDLLFAKMKEAGYEWDADKKELKEIEKKPAWSEEDEEMTEDLIKGCISAEKEHHLVHTSKEIADWLKSIKDRVKGKEDKQ